LTAGENVVQLLVYIFCGSEKTTRKGRTKGRKKQNKGRKMLDQPFIDEVSATNLQKKNMDHHREKQER
jgi:hypothetical protein